MIVDLINPIFNLKYKQMLNLCLAMTVVHPLQAMKIYRNAADSGGITREIADKYGYEYTTDYGGRYIGKNDHWDEKAGVYHD